VSIESVGILGAGLMGLGMACSAARAGFRVVVRDIDPAREALAREAGLTVVPTAAALARNADVLLIVLVDAGQIDDALAGSEGVLAALSPGRLVLVCSTIGPEDSERICARISATGAFAIDAPISGGPARAHAGSLSMMLAGLPASLEAARPLLEAVATRHFVIGERQGDAARAKLVNNLMAGIHLMAAAEAVALAERLGLDPAQITDLVSASSGQSWMADDRLPRALAGDLAPRAQSQVLAKDLRLANAAAASVGVTLPLGTVALQLFGDLCDDGWRHQDDAAALAYYRRRFGG
jgi:3-hydroxyisobutyrate dehydrogenase